MTEQEKFEFKSEARQLLELMIHSVYSNKEVFLRELISNSSDALDRRRVEAITDKSLLEDGHELEIRLEADKTARILHLHDSGIGMSKDEVIKNLGTIARSGTKEFVQNLKSQEGDQTAELIGQFGVGFYSAFMVADEVTVVTRRAGESEATRWTSSGDGSYTVEAAEKEDIGTTVSLRLRDADPDNALPDFTDDFVLRSTVKKHSDFVTHPIKLRVEETKEEEGKDPEVTITWPTINSMKAIWTRPSSDVTDDEYNEFYRHISHDWAEPLDRVSFKAEGTFEYQTLLFIPENPPMDMYWRDAKYGLQLYVNRVLIQDRCEELVPSYLRFLKGVVDSPDLSLNVSREMLQQDRRLTQIRKRIVKKVLDALQYIQKSDREKYIKFWNAFGRVLKEGIVQEQDQKDAMKELLMFYSSADDEKLTSLDEYIERMKEDQDTIYYITGESRKAVERSPHLESLKAKGYEVLFLIDPVDELVSENVSEYKEKKLKSVSKGEVNLGSEEEKKEAEEKRKEAEKSHESLLKAIQEILNEDLKEVRMSSRLTASAACLVGGEDDISPQLERLLEQAGQKPPKQKRILELNPEHHLLGKMNALHIADDKQKLSAYAQIVYGQALLAEGSALPDPMQFNQLVTEVLVDAAS
ncbi:MAG: molecular chaperone HtpG [Myxococcota bacterium]|nr:molecular chaperone HtpG [Myxococcota bacterium]